MLPSSFQVLATLQLLVHAVFANPVMIRNSPVTLPLSRRLNLTSAHNLLRHDQARARGLRARAERSLGRGNSSLSMDAIVNEPIANQAVWYEAFIGVGSPPTTYFVRVDTGSSNTWIGANQAYVRTSTSVQTSNKVSVTYGSGSFSGVEFTDTVTIAPGLVIQGQSIGVASTASGFEIDGVLGLGPVGLTLGTLSPATASTIPTVVDNLFSQGMISSNLISISFQPISATGIANGEITWGGGDSSRFVGTTTFQSLTTTEPASEFWGITAQSIRYGASTTIQTQSAGIVDTGTTLVLIASDAFNRYRSVTGAVLDATTGLLRITPAQFENLQSLFIITTSVTLELTANAQLWPRSLNTFIGGVSSSIYLVIGDIGTPTGEGFDFILGYAFLERYFVAFDTTNDLIGFAQTKFTAATNN